MIRVVPSTEPTTAGMLNSRAKAALSTAWRYGPGSIARLSEKADVTRQAITKHLEILADAGLVSSHKNGRERVWQLEPKRLSDAHDHLDAISKQWDIAIERLKQLVEDE